MPRTALAALLVLVLSSSTWAQNVSAIIPMSAGHPSAGGFRDIPPGPQVFQVTIQSNSGPFPLAGINNGGGQVTWVPQGPTSGVSAITWVTTTAVTESQVGTVSGWAYFMGGPPPGYTVSSFCTSNATFSGGDLNPFISGIYQDPGDVVLPTDVGAPAASYPGTNVDYYALHSFSIANYQDGYVWFTSDDTSVAVYWLDTSSNTWILLNQPTFFAANSGTFPSIQFAVHVGDSLTGDTTVTLRYRAVNSINPGGDGDTLDVLNIVLDREYNPPDQ